MNRARTSTGRAQWPWIALAAFALAVVVVVDDITGTEASASLLYLVPVSIAAWFVSLRAGAAFAVAGATAWAVTYVLSRHFVFRPPLLYWNAGVETAVYLIVATLLSTIRVDIERQRALSARLERAFQELDRESARVGALQRQMLPGSAPPIPGYRVSIHYSPSARAGGDAYDFFDLEEGTIGLWISDASGHGSPAAVVMAMTRALVRGDDRASSRPDRFLESANRRLQRIILPGQFVTACFAVFGPRPGELEYALAGHNPPLLARRAGTVERLDRLAGLPLGLFANATYQPATASVQPGDTLLFYTDGLTEAMDPDQCLFGIERLEQVMVEYRHLPEAELRDRLLDALREHRKGAALSDDVTFVVVRAWGTTSG